MFSISTEKLNDLTQIRLKNIETGESVAVIPEFGGALNEIIFFENGELLSVFKGNNERKAFATHDAFRGALLFPFANRIKDGKYTFNGIAYQLPVNYPEENNACHGFLFSRSMDIEDQQVNKQSARLSLRYRYGGDYPGYPFLFELNVHYELNKNDGFTCRTVLRNNGHEPLPFSMGWHPYFALGTSINRLQLKLPSGQRIELNERMIPIGRIIPFDEFQESRQIGDLTLDDCFRLESGRNRYYVELSDSETEMVIQLWLDAGDQGFNYLQIYIPPQRNGIALEPMTSNIDAFNNGQGLLILNPEANFEASWGVKHI